MRARLLHRLAAISLGALICGSGLASAQELPRNHPIHDLTPLGTEEDRQPKRLPPPVDPLLSWSFVLSKPAYELGEPIWGTLTVTNLSTRHTVLMSPPYCGEFVTTVGVWVSRKTTRDGEAAWSAFQETIPNAKTTRATPRLLAGIPIELAPGATVSQQIAVNIYQENDKNDGTATWLSGIGFARPGAYRFYLRYLNLQERAPYGSPELAKVWESNGERWPLAFKPVVLGPYSVLVRQPTGELAGETTRRVQGWEAALLKSMRTRRPLDPTLDLGLSRPPPPGNLNQAVAFLARARSQLYAPRGLPLGEHRRRLESLVKELGVVRRRLPEGPLRSDYLRTEARVLAATDREGEAQALLNGDGSADARVQRDQLD